VVKQETRKFDLKTKESLEFRKEDASVDFRYLADPDIPILKVNAKRVEKCQEILSQRGMPFSSKTEMMTKYGISSDECSTIMSQPLIRPIFEKICEGRDAKVVYRWVYMILARISAEEEVPLQVALEKSMRNGDLLGEIIDEVDANTRLSRSGAKQLIQSVIDCKFSDKIELNGMITQTLDELSKQTKSILSRF